jgi:hypothetical protein
VKEEFDLERSKSAETEELGNLVLFYVAGIALLTLLVNGTTMEALLGPSGLGLSGGAGL